MHLISTGGALGNTPFLLEIFYVRMSFFIRLRNSPTINPTDEFLRIRVRITRATVLYMKCYMKSHSVSRPIMQIVFTISKMCAFAP